MLELPDTFDVVFVGNEKNVRIKITGMVQDPYGHILWLVGSDGSIYNWDNIIRIRKVRN